MREGGGEGGRDTERDRSKSLGSGLFVLVRCFCMSPCFSPSAFSRRLGEPWHEPKKSWTVALPNHSRIFSKLCCRGVFRLTFLNSISEPKSASFCSLDASSEISELLRGQISELFLNLFSDDFSEFIFWGQVF